MYSAGNKGPNIRTVLPKIKSYTVFSKTFSGSFEIMPNTIFTAVPNMDEAFHVIQNTLFKITVQARIINQVGGADHFLQVLVNGNLVIGNKIVPNNEKRVNFGLGPDIWGVDTTGGYFYSPNLLLGIPITRVSFIYLSPGTYRFDVGTRCVFNKVNFGSAIVTFELTQFEDEHQQSIGSYHLLNIPQNYN
ncbi:unnamed protein product [Rotaria magnacalcarata]|uniref:Uncharacterized protein n=2 Tax=Rotaria magnacalcarata TaxID=392030 RepID=A0A815YA11_9BILA|nr:unnamed protein product [Rotaria magnacalcarata]